MNKIQFLLFVAGPCPNSLAAVRNLEHFCMTLPQGSFEVEVVDVLAHAAVALRAEIVATPTLVVSKASCKARRLIGTLKDPVQLQSLVADAPN